MKIIPIFGASDDCKELREVVEYEGLSAARKVARFFGKYNRLQNGFNNTGGTLGFFYAHRAILDTTFSPRVASLLCKIVGIEP